MNEVMVMAVVRHVLTAVGAGLAASYGIDGEALGTVISGLVAASGLAWSLYDKSGNRQ